MTTILLLLLIAATIQVIGLVFCVYKLLCALPLSLWIIGLTVSSMVLSNVLVAIALCIK